MYGKKEAAEKGTPRLLDSVVNERCALPYGRATAPFFGMYGRREHAMHVPLIHFRTLAVTTRMSALSLNPAVPTTTFSPSRIRTSLRILASVPGTDNEKVKSPN